MRTDYGPRSFQETACLCKSLRNIGRMPAKVSMADVAERAGVSVATVSRALKNNPRISGSTRQRIVKLSERMGYRPNPLVNALMANRRGRDTGGADTIAFVTDYRRECDWADKPSCVDIFAGLKERARELGYKVEVFSLLEVGGSPLRLEQVLRARGIRGVIFGFAKNLDFPIEMNGDGLACVGIAHYFRQVKVDRVICNGLNNVRLGLRKLTELGYRRTGLVVPLANNRIIGNAWTAGYLDHQWTLPPRSRFRPLLPEDWRMKVGEFHKWFEAEKPDSIIAYKVDVRGLLRKLRLRCPADVGVAQIYREAGEMDVLAGVDERMHDNGTASVDLVVEKLHGNRFGFGDPTRSVQIDGTWRDGPSVAVTSGAR